MKFNVYKLDYLGGGFVPTKMGEFATEAGAQAAQDEFRKTHSASWMISCNQPAPFAAGKPVSLADL